MPIQLSPNFTFTETDLSLVTPTVPAATAAYAGVFQKGPIGLAVLITDENELKEVFGLPDTTTYEHWWTVWNFLQYSGSIYVTRAIDATVAINAGIELLDTAGVLSLDNTSLAEFIPNVDDFDETSITRTATTGMIAFFARDAGTYANAAGTAPMKLAWTNDAAGWAAAEVLTGGLLFSEVFPAPIVAGEAAIVVLDDEDNVLDKYLVSLTPGAKNDSNELYYIDDYIRNNSRYIHAYAADASMATLAVDTLTATELAGGLDGAPAAGDVQTAYDLFLNKGLYDVTFVIGGANTDAATTAYITGSVVEVRRDCISILDCLKSDVQGTGLTDSTRVTNLRTTFDGMESKYAFALSNWKYQYDKFAEKYRWIPCGGDIAGIMARSATENDPWIPAAGPRRGQIKNVGKLAWNPELAYRDQLYVNRINPIASIQGQGTMLFGQKMLTWISSSLNRANVRMLLIYIEKALGKVLPFYLFELNTDFTRAQVTSVVEGFMDDIEARDGVYDPNGGPGYMVVCDTTNNTAERIDRHELQVDLYLKPAQSIEFIVLGVIVTRSGAKFEELVSK